MNRGVRAALALVAVLAAIIAITLFLAPKHQKKTVQAPNDDPWLLVSYDPDNQAGTYLGNGFISARIMGSGVGSQTIIDDYGREKTILQPCFMAGVYEDEKIVPVHTWSDLRFYDGETQFCIDKRAGYKQVLNLRTGILTTHATWRAGRKTLKGKIEFMISRARPHSALLKATVTPNFKGVLKLAYLSSLPKNYSPVFTSIPSAKSPKVAKATGGSVEGYVYEIGSTGLFVGISSANLLKIGSAPQSITLAPIYSETCRVERNSPVELHRFTSLFAGSDPDQVGKAARDEAKLVMGWNRTSSENAIAVFVSEHKAAWDELWKRHIQIEGSPKDQQAVNSCKFYLLQSVREGSQWSIPPMGLSADSFSGHIFWDADIWMFPALLLQYPELARSIVDYRYNTLSGALANAKANGYAGAEYAWESGETGREDTPAGLLYSNERHINGDIALAQWQYYLATGDREWLRTRGYPVIKGTADYWVSRVVLNDGRYEIRQIVPPDENAEFVDNNAYTNAIAKMNLQIAELAAAQSQQPKNPKWATVAASLYIPFDEKGQRFIAHDNDKGHMAKQADTELLAYPLQFTLPGRDMKQIYRNTLDYYGPKVGPKGPAMTHSAHSVIYARLGNCDKAYDAFKRCYEPYLRGGLNYFNETSSDIRTNYCFLTGCAGPIQSILLGMAGINIDYFPANPDASELNYAPCLPGKWKSLKVTGVQWRGKSYDISIDDKNKLVITDID